MKLHRFALIAALVMMLSIIGASGAHAQDTLPVVHVVLFYSPTCAHCQYVITEVLPPLYEKYGQQLQIIGFDVTHPQGQTLFAAAAKRLTIDTPAVPLVVIDDIYLVGSKDIPDQLPALIKSYLDLGGVGWPDIPGLHELLISAAQSATAQAATPGTASSAPSGGSPSSAVPNLDPTASTWLARFQTDPAGNTLAVVVLVALIASLVWAIVHLKRRQSIPFAPKLAWTIPWLCLVGAAVAAYLAYVELFQASAACGPIGDCTAVHASSYARLFAVLPIGLIGLLGYLAIAAAWLMSQRARASAQYLAGGALFVLPALGTLFSIYLTFLEPFVIGATCMWCLLSSLLIAVLTLLGVEPARLALSEARAPVSPQQARPARSRTTKTR